MKRPIRLILPVVLLALLLSAANLTAAQPDATPTPSATPNRTLLPVLTRAETEMLFPVAIRFSVTLNVPLEDVISLYLRIYQAEGSLNVTPLLDTRRDGIALDPRTALITYLWEFTAEEAPAPFTPLRYEWQIQTAFEGISAASGEFLFQDTLRGAPQPALRWQISEAPIQLYSHNADLALNLLHQNALRVYTLVSQQTNIAPSQKIVIYDPETTFCQRDLTDAEGEPYIESRTIGGTRRACDPNTALTIYERYGFNLIRRQTLAFNELQDRLTEQIVSRAYAVLWENAPSVPLWFSEGLTRLYNITPNSGALSILLERLRGNRPIFTLRELIAQPEALSGADLRVWQAQSYLLTLYLADRAGAEAPFALARDLGTASDFEQALRARFGIGSAALYNEWQAWLRSERAARAVRWTPYLETTPTPTATRTATSTRTAAPPRSSPTPLPTITAAFFPSITPIMTATFTALPPGSIQRPTPVPPPASGNPCGGAPLITLIPVGMALTLRLSRRMREML